MTYELLPLTSPKNAPAFQPDDILKADERRALSMKEETSVIVNN
jgi:hypothetical protein